MAGIYISPFDPGPATSLSLVGDIPNLDVLRSGLLYWDKIIFPLAMPGAMPVLEDNLRFLADQGALTLYNMIERNEMDVSGWAKDFFEKTNELFSRRDEAWSVLFPRGTEYSLPEFFLNFVPAEITQKVQEKVAQATLEIAIRNALPVPPPDTPFEDILRFKRERAGELDQLTTTIELLAAQLNGAPPAEAAHLGARHVSKAIESLDRVFRERWQARFFKTLRANLGTIAVSSVGAAAAWHSAPLLSAGVLGAGVRPLFSAAISTVTSSRILPEGSRPYLYAYEASQNFNAT